MDGLRGCFAKWNKSYRKRHTLYDFPSLGTYKTKQTNITKQIQTRGSREWTGGYQTRGKGEGGMSEIG